MIRYVEADFGADLGGRMVKMSWNAQRRVRSYRAASDHVRSLAKRHHPRAGSETMSPTSVLPTNRVFGVDAMEFLDSDAMQEKTGTDRYLCALLDNRGGHVNPLGYARGMAQAQFRLVPRCMCTPATRVWREGTTWRVATPTGTVTADRLVIERTLHRRSCRSCAAALCRSSAVSPPASRYRTRLCRTGIGV